MIHSMSLLLIASLTLASASTFTNPLKPKNGADPFIIRSLADTDNQEPGYYYLLNTASQGQIEMIRSETLDGLKTGETQIVWSDSTPSRCCSLWAPEVHELGGTYYMFYTAGPDNSPDRTPHVLKGGSF